MSYKDMPTEEVAQILDEAQAELVRRQNVGLLGERLAQVQNEFRDSNILIRPDHGSDWSRPEEAEHAYGEFDVVTFKGNLREATAGIVVCDPECEYHWKDYVEPEDPDSDNESEQSEWSGEGVNLSAGDRVLYEDSVYRVKEAHVTKPQWTPSSMPGLFEEMH